MNKLLTHEVRHKYAGNGWAIAEIVNDEYFRLVSIGPSQIGKQAFLAWAPLCSVETRTAIDKQSGKESTIEVQLNQCVTELVSDLRSKIETRMVSVVATRFVEARSA